MTYMPEAYPVPHPTPGPPPSGYGQSVVGRQIQSAWWAGQYEITQGWGQTEYTGEPAQDRQGKHYAHWHAGIDVGAPCGTHLHLPSGITDATVSALDNPGGYGTAVIVHLTAFDVYIGHLARRLVNDGQKVRGGQEFGVSNNTGNSTGCHIHFEVRPKDGKYGTDVDPVLVMSSGQDTAGKIENPLDAFGKAVSQAEASFAHTLVSGGQVALGAVAGLGGILLVALGPMRAKGMVVHAAASVASNSAKGGSSKPAVAPVAPAASPKPLLRGR